jgi:hypothetical protein
MTKKGKKKGGRRDDGGDKDKKGTGKGKGGKNGKGRSECGYFMDASVYDDNSSSESKLKAARDAKKWYDAFTHTIRKNDVKMLREKAVPFKISWDVATVLAQLNDVYERIDRYQEQADAEVRRLEGLVGTGVGGVFSKKLVNEEGLPVDTNDTVKMTELFKSQKLFLDNMNVYSIFKSGMRVLFAEAKKVAQSDDVSKGPVRVDYDTFNRCFYAHFGTTTDLQPQYSVKFIVKDSKLVDVMGMDYYSIPILQPLTLVIIVPYVLTENELKLASRNSSRKALASSSTRRSTRTDVSI